MHASTTAARHPVEAPRRHLRARLAPVGPYALGERVGDEYVVTDHLGRGGMGVVYEVEDPTQRTYALKVARSAEFAQALHREAEVLASVRHRGVVSLHAQGRHRGLEYLVLTRLQGGTLRTRLDAARVRQERIELGEVFDVLHDLVDALGAVHAAGFAHRDLKPENVMFDPHAVLVDFGLTAPDSASDDGEDLGGTPEYVAPEIVCGRVRHFGAGPLGDLYALGMLAYELLIGRTPFAAGDSSLTLHHQLYTPPPHARALRDDVPTALDELIDQLLAKRPEDRPQSCDEVRFRLWAMRT